mmetsp:Transcript_10178/g.10505  ORF Transcript_10178/g.10505 Transcript_10178/m.10505 type:complete len:156 (+) Transcript_10178:2091-2558(+)
MLSGNIFLVLVILFGIVAFMVKLILDIEDSNETLRTVLKLIFSTIVFNLFSSLFVSLTLQESIKTHMSSKDEIYDIINYIAELEKRKETDKTSQKIEEIKSKIGKVSGVGDKPSELNDKEVVNLIGPSRKISREVIGQRMVLRSESRKKKNNINS